MAALVYHCLGVVFRGTLLENNMSARRLREGAAIYNPNSTAPPPRPYGPDSATEV